MQTSLKSELTRPIRVLQVVPDLGVGGLSRVVESICATLDKERFEVSVLSFHGGGEFADVLRTAGVPVFTLGSRDFRQRTSYASFIDVARLLRREGIDVLHTHNTQPFLDAVPGGVLARVRTMIHTDHARHFPDRWRYMFAERVLSRFVYRVVGVSEDTSRNLVRYEKISPRKIVTIPNGISGSVYDVPVDRDAKRRELGLAPNAKVLGFASRLEPQKGIPYLLEAMPEIVRRSPDVVLLIVGQGREQQQLERQVAALDLQASVRFLGVRFDMPQMLGLFDIMVLPSIWEGLPMIILEAMAAGCPVVATAVGGVPTAVRNGETGILIEPKVPGAIADAVVTLLEDPERRQRFGAAARRVFREEFTAEAMTRHYEKLYLRQDHTQVES
jgi:glycosyltransferase involved in cell wall biosynthesis